MGLAASQGREIFLTSRKTDLEFKVQVINQRRTTLAQQASQLARAFANSMYNTDNTTLIGAAPAGPLGLVGAMPGFIPPSNPVPVAQTAMPSGSYEVQMASVQALDKELELREKDLQTQNKIVETELEAVRKVIDKSIEKGFKTLG